MSGRSVYIIIRCFSKARRSKQCSAAVTAGIQQVYMGKSHQVSRMQSQARQQHRSPEKHMMAHTCRFPERFLMSLAISTCRCSGRSLLYPECCHIHSLGAKLPGSFGTRQDSQDYSSPRLQSEPERGMGINSCAAQAIGLMLAASVCPLMKANFMCRTIAGDTISPCDTKRDT